ncbi:MAG: ferrous iron transport protein B [Clostridia bacterium]|nr:ferrous iron transport protein B [Clostridia bacterium]
MRNLENLKLGETGIVKNINSTGTLRRRLIDLGVTAGARVKIERFAPFGDPIIVNINNYNLVMRKKEAREIEIFEDNNVNIYNYDLTKKTRVTNLFPENIAKNNKYKIALLGNPNSGKSTLFNLLTGTYQYVGNWPGVTVQKKTGRIRNIKENIELVDLPGVYSLSPYTSEEIVTRNYIMNECPDLVVNVIDSTNLERNLYLTTQLLELDCRVIIVLNMTDLLKQKNKIIDIENLEKNLGVPIIGISAGKNTGIDDLLAKIRHLLKSNKKVRYNNNLYSESIENSLNNISDIVNPGKKYILNNRFKTVKIFENDELIIQESNLNQEQINKINELREKISQEYNKKSDIIIPDERYIYIQEICKKSVKNINNSQKNNLCSKLDDILTGKYTAILFFVLILFLIFYITFGKFGVFLKEFCESFINGYTRDLIVRLLKHSGASAWTRSLVSDAVIGGVGSVISFLPQVILLFGLLSVLEDCGYMARVTFIMDKLMRKIGLSGKAFVSFVMGFGCTVPAVMSTKILENKKDRNLAIFMLPFISCSAKMPIYLMFTSIFFPKYKSLIVFLLYIIGVACAVLTAYIFKDSLFQGEESPFVLEMPDYKIPSFKNIKLNIWDKTKDFVERAGTIILFSSIIIWFLQYFDINFRFALSNSNSILSKIGNLIAPVFKICGFGNWKACVSLVTGLLAKESIVSTLSVLYFSQNYKNITEAIMKDFSTASAISFMIFSLLYTPCIAAVSVIFREFTNKKYAIISTVYQISLAYILSALSYQTIILFQNIL